MIVKITAKRQVTPLTHLLDAMGVGPGDTHELSESPDESCEIGAYGSDPEKSIPGASP